MRSYLVLRLNHRKSRQRLVNKIVCSPKQLLNKLNALIDSHGEYAYKTIREVIDSYTDDDSSMTIIDLATLDFIST
jgi:predicted SpoU family rRNA methylase